MRFCIHFTWRFSILETKRNESTLICSKLLQVENFDAN